MHHIFRITDFFSPIGALGQRRVGEKAGQSRRQQGRTLGERGNPAVLIGRVIFPAQGAEAVEHR